MQVALVDAEAVVSEARKDLTTLKIALMDGINHAPSYKKPEEVMKHDGEFANEAWNKAALYVDFPGRIIHLLVTH